jgi:hypothetical protein
LEGDVLEVVGIRTAAGGVVGAERLFAGKVEE